MDIVVPRTAAIQAELIALVKKAFGKTLKKVEGLPGAWTETTVRRIVMASPAVYVAWIGSRPSSRPDTVISSWALFSVAGALSAQPRDPIAAHDINDRLIGLLNNRRLESACMGAVFTQAANLYTDTSAKTGIVVCGLYFDIPHVQPVSVDEGDIGNFDTYFHQWAEPDGTPEQGSLNTGLYDQ